MIDNKLHSLLLKLKAKVKEVSGKIREDELIYMINLMARTEMKLKQNDNSFHEEFEKEISNYL